MALTFANFKQQIPATILERGRAYLRQGRVVDLEYDEAEDSWAVQVAGTALYEVSIERGPDGELTGRCDCPYEFGDHCHHIAAALYAIEEAFPNALGVKPRQANRAKRRTKIDKLAEALEQTPADKVRDMLLAWAGEDRAVLNGLLVRLDAAGDKPQNYRALVKQALSAGRGEYGFIDYYGARRAAAQLESLLAQAGRMVDDDRPGPALALYQAILEQTLAALEQTDDSDGDLSGIIPDAINGLAAAGERLLPPERQALFDYALLQVSNPAFTGFDMHWDMYRLAASLIDNSPERRRQLFATLDSVIESSMAGGHDFTRSYAAEAAARIKLDIIQQTEGEEAAFHYTRSHVHLDGFRRELISTYIARDELAEASRLAEEGVALSEAHNYPGLTIAYWVLLLDIAHRRRDKAATRYLARRLWLGTGEKKYYTLLKEHTPRQEWPGVLEALIRDSRGGRPNVAWLLAQEGLWPQLLALAQTSSLESMTAYRADLEKRFPNEMSEIYERAAVKLLANVSGRETYRDAADLLRRMAALGKSERAREVAALFMQQFPQRRAMIEELRRV